MKFLRDDRGLETVEYAIIAGCIIAFGTVLTVVVIGLWVKVQARLLGGNASYSGGP